MHREPDLIDVWFDLGAMPYAQIHYPLENKEVLTNVKYSGKLHQRGRDQTRGWFFTLNTIATMLFDSVAFKNVISSGLVLGQERNKMSNRLGNAVDPFQVLADYGADATRWYMLTNSQPWDNLKFDTDGVDEVRRKFFGTLYNTYSSFAPCQRRRIYGPRRRFRRRTSGNRPLDPLAAEHADPKNVTESLESYDPTPAARAIPALRRKPVELVRRLNRKRTWSKGPRPTNWRAFQTLYTCLRPSRCCSAVRALLRRPAVPRPERREQPPHGKCGPPEHLPDGDEICIDPELEETMDLAQRLSSMVLALRRKSIHQVRQPLQKILIPVLDPATARRPHPSREEAGDGRGERQGSEAIEKPPV